jgi:hypothetical protein
MAAPIALSPLLWTAVRYGAVIALAAYAARVKESQPKDPHREHVLDDLPVGVHAHSHRAEAERAAHGHGRFRRTLRFGANRPGLEIDLSALGRVRFRRVG